MKKYLALLLAFALVLSFAACKNKLPGSKNEDDSTAEPTGRPGDMVTDASGNVQTTNEPYLVLDENSEPQTTIITDKDGATQVVPVTTLVYEILTYPPAEGQTLVITTQPTQPANATIASNHDKWPTYSFMSKVPQFADAVDRVDYNSSKNDTQHTAVMWINECTYADFLKYVDTCKAAGFKPISSEALPQTEAAGAQYIFYSTSNGLWFSITFSSDTAPYRFCDLLITVSDYDVGNISNIEGIN